MRRVTILISAVVLFVAPGGAAEGAGFAGHWDGEIKIPNMPLGVRVHLEQTEDGGWTGRIDIPLQNAIGLPLANIVVTGDSITFTMANVPGDPTFTGVLAEDRITGPFTQGGRTFEFALERGAAGPPRRPQDPEPPFPYRSEDVTFSNGDVTLAGTLTVPESDGPFPAIVLLTGSGPQNRDEELFNHRPFLVIADHLSRNGIVVLRYDDRGVGGSGGNPATSTTEDFARDALEAVALLQARDEVAGDRVGMLGHSEGAMSAVIAASRSAEVAFLVLLAGPGVPMSELLAQQAGALARAQGLSEDEVAEHVSINRRLTAAATRDGDPEEIEAELRQLIHRQYELTPEENRPPGDNLEAAVSGHIAQLKTPWFQFLLSYDPRVALRRVGVPVLALNGELDLQVVHTQNLPAIEAALAEAGNADVTTRSMPGLNHMFQHAAKGTVEEYGQIEETISPEVLDMITLWLVERFAGAAR